MCGITGFIHFSAETEQANTLNADVGATTQDKILLTKMNQAQFHRGPDEAPPWWAQIAGVHGG